MRNSPRSPLLALALIISALPLDPSRSAPPVLPEAAQATPQAALQALRKFARTPAEKVALTDAWIKAHPTATPRPAASSARKSAPARELTGKAALQEEISWNLREMRAESPDPNEEIRLVDEFLRLNKDAIESLKEAQAANSKVVRETASAHIQSQLVANPNDVSAQMAAALMEARARANPFEQIRWVDEFFLLNKDLLEEMNNARVTLKTNPHE